MARIGKPPVKPIVSKHCLDRLVIDLMDFRGMPDRDFKWILQMKDHFSRFIWVYALKDKASETVGKILRSWFKQNGYPTKWYIGTALYTTIPVRPKDSSASSLSFEPLSI
jgi:transposase InsO family protein